MSLVVRIEWTWAEDCHYYRWTIDQCLRRAECTPRDIVKRLKYLDIVYTMLARRVEVMGLAGLNGKWARVEPYGFVVPPIIESNPRPARPVASPTTYLMERLLNFPGYAACLRLRCWNEMRCEQWAPDTSYESAIRRVICDKIHDPVNPAFCRLCMDFKPTHVAPVARLAPRYRQALRRLVSIRRLRRAARYCKHTGIRKVKVVNR